MSLAPAHPEARRGALLNSSSNALNAAAIERLKLVDSPRLFHKLRLLRELFADQLAYIANHAEDQVLCFDMSFLPVIKAIWKQCTTVKHWVALCEADALPADSPQREFAEIAKREVERGRFRVYSRVVETPVEESVRLREERVEVLDRAQLPGGDRDLFDFASLTAAPAT